ncbi:MAG TPA: sulfite exporter TauE/SafE family protein [Cyclobacteriaceae bacterium]|nr:sulfite exporter TauE/SafE family protein [Cyclobacteriaceae bacterium]
MEFLLFFLLTLIAEIAGTVGGFGSSVFFVSLGQFFYSFQTILALTGILHVFSNTSKLIFFWKTIDWRLVIWIGLSSVALAIGGAILTRWVEFTYAKMLLGIFLIALATILLSKPKSKITPTLANSVTGGALAGFLAGFIGTGGAIRGVVLTAFSLEKNFFVGTSAAIDFGVDFSRMIIYLDNGFLPEEYIWYIPSLIVGAFLGSYLGKRILDRISQDTFRNIILGLILAIGLSLVIKESQVLFF